MKATGCFVLLLLALVVLIGGVLGLSFKFDNRELLARSNIPIHIRYAENGGLTEKVTYSTAWIFRAENDGTAYIRVGDIALWLGGDQQVCISTFAVPARFLEKIKDKGQEGNMSCFTAADADPAK